MFVSGPSLPPIDAVMAELGYERPDVPIHVRWDPWDSDWRYCCPQATPCARHVVHPKPGLTKMIYAKGHRPFLDYTLDYAAQVALITYAHERRHATIRGRWAGPALVDREVPAAAYV